MQPSHAAPALLRYFRILAVRQSRRCCWYGCSLASSCYLRLISSVCWLHLQGDQLLFNRGALLNAGALLLAGSSYDYFAFQVGVVMFPFVILGGWFGSLCLLMHGHVRKSSPDVLSIVPDACRMWTRYLWRRAASSTASLRVRPYLCCPVRCASRWLDNITPVVWHWCLACLKYAYPAVGPACLILQARRRCTSLPILCTPRAHLR